MGQSGVFVLQSDNSLVAMAPAQFATEDRFQELLSRFPELLVGDQIDPEMPRRWLLVRREQPVSTGEVSASQWSIDHLFLDQDGIPTLVEIKRQSDSRIRREVVGQMLDYAANCATNWTVTDLKRGFELTCEREGRPAEDAIAQHIGPDQTSDTFWQRVASNLAEGRIRLLFVADLVPIELRRIVEFLNFQMSPAEVLAIELRQFEGEGLKTIVPVVFGHTQKADDKKAPWKPGEPWTESRMIEKIAASFSQEDVEVTQGIINAMKATGKKLIFGSGREHGSVYPEFKPGGVKINPAYLSTEGKVWLQFKSLNGKPVFGSETKRRELLLRFASVSESGLSDADLDGWASIPLSTIAADPHGLSKMQAAFTWMADTIAAEGSAKVAA